MTAEKSLPEEGAAWIRFYTAEVLDAFHQKFKDAGDRFRDSERLLDRFSKATEAVIANGRSVFRAVDEAHNELCIAAGILANPNPKFSRLDYEPPLTGCAKSIDFRASTDNGLTVFVDVKTIKPAPKDRWEQFEKASKNGWLPENVNIILSKRWLGGELWHNKFAARSRMLEYSLELEQKIHEYKLSAEKAAFILALCGEGFYWHQDELEDFVAFYYTGSYRPNDPFSRAEAKHIDEKKLIIAKTIFRFACMSRPQGDIYHRRLNWNVQPPTDPSFE